MSEDFEPYDELEQEAFSYNEEPDANNYADIADSEEYDSDDDFDDFLNDFDFSEITGKNFKKSFNTVSRKIEKKSSKKPIRKPVVSKPISKNHPLKKGKNYQLESNKQKQIGKIIVPSDKNVIVEGVSKFILSQSKQDNVIKNIGYYKGKKLKELVLTFNNNSALDFNLELFNPSMPLDYLYSTSLNLNDKVNVAGGNVSYSDILHYLLANPTMICNCKFVFAGPNVSQQISKTLFVKNKSTTGEQMINPLSLPLQIDNMQVAQDIVFFDIMDMLNRPYIPDGMDVIKYTVMPQMTVTMAFFYKQISLKKVFYKEARDNKKIM